ncbi:hypothetical protein B0T26DRAFT_674107 [Lasiosphaeria miniovina]|uniref:Uncharacterized protein n=1 Tax=Lasiosphaeria miniovina TaxID=1954250 RepID=A0AA40AUV1_9PEZI|nr:uncharacterized protein B0T26DRAFT_674107 [Lasiosphaeria miniovina]KAK0722397.1 hypothetical protein B0T26DRAFT_674107 [Lasiosphaeria miniovina]
MASAICIRALALVPPHSIFAFRDVSWVWRRHIVPSSCLLVAPPWNWMFQTGSDSNKITVINDNPKFILPRTVESSLKLDRMMELDREDTTFNPPTKAERRRQEISATRRSSASVAASSLRAHERLPHQSSVAADFDDAFKSQLP